MGGLGPRRSVCSRDIAPIRNTETGKETEGVQKTAEVVIIGGGVMGASIAYHLAMRGCTDVIVLEAKSLAAEGTGHSGALVRQHYSQDVVTEIALRSVRIFEDFEELTGQRNVFQQTGWIKIGSEDMRVEMERLIVRHRRIGVEVRMLSMQDLRAMIPGINTDGVGFALFEPRGGHADPVATTLGFANVARSKGVAICEGVAATGIRLNKGRVAAVETAAGTIQTSLVVNAAGPWGGRVGSWAGVDVPVQVTREQDVVLACDDESLMPRYPVSNGVDRDYWRRKDGSMLLVGDGHPKQSDYADPDNFSREADRPFGKMIMERLHFRLPEFAKHARIVKGYASLYDVTPDWHPILGRVDAVEGLVLCIGFSGHGFKLGPAIGGLIAEEILDGKAQSLDISALRLSRFAKKELLQGAYAGNQA
ncbi:MAG: FAD-binding oxidoreductase [Dehalococcoidia bacterium]|nr:FAD-binding oxidoreductase [Dehalococcoidia bacterium]